MPKVIITEELGKIIKNTRNNKGIKAVDLAEKIDKSIAYISKLESASLKTIDLDSLVEIFKFLVGDDEEFESFINKVLEKLNIELTPNEIKEQRWAYIFDQQIRIIPIPSSLIEFISDKLEMLNKTPEDIIEFLNTNDELNKDIIESSKYKPNTLICDEDNCFIIFKLEKDLLSNILSKKETTSNYIKIEGIVRALLKLEGYPVEIAREETKKILSEHKFYTLEEKRKIIKSKKQSETITSLLTEFDTENDKYINNIFNHIKILSDWNIDYTNSKLKSLSESLDADTSFTLTLLGMPFYTLKNANVERKKDFLKNLKSMIEKYTSSTEEKENIAYDDF